MRPGNNREEIHDIEEINEDDDPGFLNEHFDIQEEPEADRAAPARSGEVDIDPITMSPRCEHFLMRLFTVF